MGGIIGLKGQELSTKKTHHPERVEKERLRLSQTLAKLKQDWKNDNRADPAGASRGNAEAIDEHYGQEWRIVAQSMHENSTLAVDVDFEEMANWIRGERKKERDTEVMNTPLSKVLDLTSWDFRLVGKSPAGMVWLCDSCALAVDEGGMVLLVLRAREVSLGAWVEADWLSTSTWNYGVLELPQLTLVELHMLLKVLRYSKLCPLPEALMLMARGAEGPTDAQLANAAEVRDRMTSPTGNS